MSEITQPPPDLPTQDTNSRINQANAASDQSKSNNQSAEQQSTKNTAEAETEKKISHHDPAVTLASTLAKLDSGSHFSAKVAGHEADGRAIITSELGTYLVQADQKYAQDVQKIPPETQLDIRVLTVANEIKAEIIRTPIEGSPAPTTAIPVELILTEITGNPDQASLQAPPSTAIPLEDVRAQYQATTLYKAERMAREIADKLDNLPLPTSSPNYTVYRPQAAESQNLANLTPRQVAPNVFIQEVTPQPAALLETSAATTLTSPAAEQILGQNINVQVIKTVPQVQAPLPAGLPDVVIKELNAATSLDNVKPGQLLTINIAAVAVPEARVIPGQQPPINTKEPVPVPSVAAVQTAAASTNTVIPNTPNLATPDTADPKAIISGIVIDTQQKATAAEQAGQSVAITPYNHKNGPQTFLNVSNQPDDKSKNYYLATPTSVFKFQSNTPLVPGTIVSFSVQPNEQQMPIDTTVKQSAQQALNTSPQTVSATDASANVANTVNAESGTINVSPAVLERIEQFVPQDLNELPDDWASISLALASMHSAASVAAIMSSRIPNMQNPEQITSTMLFFLAAIKAPQPARTWVGPDVSARLKQLGAGKIVDRIDHDFTRIARLGADSPAGEWRPLLIPMQNGPDISAIPMLTKQIVEEDKSDKNKKDGEQDIKIKATRFILELNFSQFGTMIIDGMLKEKRLDIILKAAKQIPFAVKMKLSRQYTDAIHNNGFDGELVVIDNSPTEFSVRKLIETMTHNANVEKNI